MKRNKAIIFISVILVFAMVLVLAAGCQKNKNDDSTQLNTNGKGKSVSLDDADRGITFAVIADKELSDIDSKISVVNTITNEKVDVDIVSKGNGKYIVFPPSGRYVIGSIYRITIDKSLKFEDYNESVKEIVFTITKDNLNSIRLVDGIVEFDKARVLGQNEFFGKRNNSNQQETFGTFNLQTNGAEVAAGDVILVNDDKAGVKEAYKIESCQRLDNTMVNVSYVKPQISEVYTEFEVSETQSLDAQSDVEIYEEFEEAIENSELAEAALTFFGAKPTFNFDVKKVDDAIKVKVAMTIPSVAAIDDFKVDLVITFDCTIKVDAKVNVDMDGNEVDAGIIAYVYNDVDTNIRLQTGYSFSEVTNLTELIENANKMQEAKAGVDAPLFTWILPIANGAVAVRYQCDLAFSFAFSGSFGVTINSQFDYMLGATYTKDDGVDTFAKNLVFDPVKSVEVDLSGSAKMKIGIANTLSLDILAGVVSLGIRAEVGNFNGLYGFMNTGNLLEENPSISGTVYFEGGFYYDIDLLVALSIGSIANIKIGDIGKSIDIAQGEIVLYSFGEESVITDIVSNNTIVLSAVETKLPEYKAFAYNLKNRGNTYDTIVSLDNVVGNFTRLSIENGVVRVLDPSIKLDDTVTLKYETTYGKTIEVVTRFIYDGTVHMDKADFVYDKSNTKTNMNDIEIELSGTMVENKTDEVVSANVEGATYNKNSNVLTIPYEALAAMDNGVNSVEIKVNNATCYASVEVIGEASALGYQRGAEYLIFTAEQVANMSKDVDFAGKTLSLQNNIDMKGAVINTIGIFNGTIEGNGYEITNYTVAGMYDKSVAFIAVNNGTINNLTLKGDVNATIAASTGKSYKVAGVVAVNKGTLSNVNFEGAVNVESTSLNAFVTIVVKAAVADGSKSGVSANATINAVSKFDIANVTFYIDGSVGANNITKSCTNAAIKDGALVKFIVE